MPSLNHQIGVIGHGRFGDALCGLLENGGFDVAAWDPKATVPDHRQFGGLQDVVVGARFVVLAVPVPVFRDTLLRIRPLLNHTQIVADVGSVKVGPEAAMREILGDDVPWVATHPLFGPNSLARGERPLRVVVCPNPSHRAAFRSVCGLLRRLECTVIPQDSQAHDRAMAEAHALGFFIAKGLLDVGASLESDVVPPSARGLQRLISAVRVDAGHLLGTLNRENPFASALRKDFLASLTSLDEALDQGDVVIEEASVAVPDLSAKSPALQEVRDLIDDLDRSLVDLLAQRARLARRARDAKAQMGAEVRDPLRETRLREDRRSWAIEHGLEPEGIDGIFGAILRASRAVQLAEPGDEEP
jgi:prephenate dehydrogenase